MTNEQLEKEKEIVRAHSKYARAVEIIAQIKSLEAQMAEQKKELNSLGIYAQQAGVDDQVARIDKLMVLYGVKS